MIKLRVPTKKLKKKKKETPLRVYPVLFIHFFLLFENFSLAGNGIALGTLCLAEIGYHTLQLVLHIAAIIIKLFAVMAQFRAGSRRGGGSSTKMLME